MQKYSVGTVINFYILRDQPIDSPCSLRSYCKIIVSKSDESNLHLRAWLNDNAMFYKTLIEKK